MASVGSRISEAVPILGVIGSGRAGSSLASAAKKAGWSVVGPLGRDDAAGGLVRECDLVVIATPDRSIAAVARSLEPGSGVVAHLAGSLGLEVLDPHERRAALHPLVALPNAELGAARLGSGATFAVSGDETARRLVSDLGGRAIEVDDTRRAEYHAAACVASNHLVALMSQVERLGSRAGVPLDAFADLVRGTVDNVMAVGPREALTGPVSRGDSETIARHLEVLDGPDEQLYLALADEAARLADRPTPVGGPQWS